ncbi:hypothetical protein BCU40_022325 [Vibrio lentus]|uniref:hypothetical protein n=1 Tax=Vibrio lentus TaxID=136468 RepID=UPI000C84B414|nr:hypothetical protein [Vibrio lentus]PMI66305.1 hypothetical protein BCU40_10575 [Vibrio lentus]
MDISPSNNFLTISEICTISIALIALFFTIYQGLRQRRHDRISVQPHLDLFESHSHFGSDVRFTLTLHNNGLGPAIIKSHKVYKGVTGTDDYELVDLRSEFSEKLVLEQIYTCRFRDNFSVPSNVQHTYLEIGIKSDDQEAVAQISTLVYEYNIEIEYECMYGRQFTLCTVMYTKDKPMLRHRSLDELPS